MALTRGNQWQSTLLKSCPMTVSAREELRAGPARHPLVGQDQRHVGALNLKLFQPGQRLLRRGSSVHCHRRLDRGRDL